MRLSIEGSHFLSRGVLKVQGRGRTQSTYSVDCPRLEERLCPGGGSNLELWGLCVCHQLTEGKMMERRKKIALELSELVVYCRPVPFDEESKDQGPEGCTCVWVPSMGVQGKCQVPECGGWGAGPQHCLGKRAL